jgi:hypothetical protein
MQMYFERAERKMSTIYKEPGARMTTRIILRRFWFANSGFQELDQLTDVLATMNQTLMLIAPPLPQYSSLYLPAGDFQPESATATTARVDPVEVTEVSQSDPPAPVISHASLYSTCLNILYLIASEVPHNLSLTRLHARLAQWGQGLFANEPTSLDAIFENNPDDTETIRLVIARALVYIAVIEGMLRAIIHQEIN